MRLSISMLLAAIACTSAAVHAADSPGYQGGRLTVPRVDTPEQVGKYQDGVLQMTPQGTFTITGVQELGRGTVYNLGGISAVEVVKVATAPGGVFLRVTGNDSTCDYAGALRIHQRRDGAKFEVNLSAPHLRPIGEPQICPAVIATYRVTVPLEVYGLSAGTYTYTVNGGHAGQFTLDQDAKFADDCDVQRGGGCGLPLPGR